MAGEKATHALKEYRSAFMHFANCSAEGMEIRLFAGALVRYEDQTYRVCHYDDLLEEFKGYFKAFDTIYIETPVELWEIMTEDHLTGAGEEKLTGDLYEAWWLYWEQQMRWYARADAYEKVRADSWEDCKDLGKELIAGRLKLSSEITDMREAALIPIVALTIRRQFANEENFYRECLDLLIEDYPEYFADDAYFNEVDLAPEQPGSQLYYIFHPEYGYDI